MPQILDVQKSLGEPQLVALAREIAMDIQPIETILKQFGLDSDALERISKLPRFQNLLAEQCELWQSAMNTPDRVKAKAAAALEDFLPELYRRLHDNKEGLQHVVKGAELMGKLAGLGVHAPIGGGGGPGFHLEIHIGDGKPPTTVNLTPRVTLEAEAIEIEEDDAE